MLTNAPNINSENKLTQAEFTSSFLMFCDKGLFDLASNLCNIASEQDLDLNIIELKTSDSLLHSLVKKQSIEGLKCLLETKKIDFSKVNNEGKTALHCAIELCDDTAIPKLNDEQLAINDKPESSLKISLVCVQILSYFMKQAPNTNIIFNIQDKMGNTILHTAALTRSIKCLEILRKIPCIDLSIRNVNSQTALDLIERINDNEELKNELFNVYDAPSKQITEVKAYEFYFPAAIHSVNQKKLKKLRDEFEVLKLANATTSPPFRFDTPYIPPNATQADIDNFATKLPDDFILQPDILNAHFDFSENALSTAFLIDYFSKTPFPEELIAKLKSTSNCDNALHYKLLCQIYQALLPKFNHNQNEYNKRLGEYSKEINQQLINNNLGIKFRETEINLLPNTAVLFQLPILNGIDHEKVYFYNLCSGLLEDKFYTFNSQFIRQQIPYLLCKMSSSKVLELALECWPYFKHTQRLICIYIVKEVLLLNVFFEDTLSEKYPFKTEPTTSPNESSCQNNLIILYHYVKDYVNNPFYKNFTVLKNIIAEHAPAQQEDIVKYINYIVNQTPSFLQKYAFEKKDTRFLANEFFTLTRLGLELYPLNIIRNKKETDNLPLFPYWALTQAKCSFVYDILMQQPSKTHAQTLALFIHTIKSCLSVYDNHDFDVNSTFFLYNSIMNALRKQPALAKLVDKKSQAILESIPKLLTPDKNHLYLNLALFVYPDALPLFLHFDRDFGHSKESGKTQLDAMMYAILSAKKKFNRSMPSPKTNLLCQIHKGYDLEKLLDEPLILLSKTSSNSLSANENTVPKTTKKTHRLSAIKPKLSRSPTGSLPNESPLPINEITPSININNETSSEKSTQKNQRKTSENKISQTLNRSSSLSPVETKKISPRKYQKMSLDSGTLGESDFSVATTNSSLSHMEISPREVLTNRSRETMEAETSASIEKDIEKLSLNEQATFTPQYNGRERKLSRSSSKKEPSKLKLHSHK